MPCASRSQRPVQWMRTGSNRCRPVSRVIGRVVSHLLYVTAPCRRMLIVWSLPPTLIRTPSKMALLREWAEGRDPGPIAARNHDQLGALAIDLLENTPGGIVVGRLHPYPTGFCTAV